jgi:hypothetical protein
LVFDGHSLVFEAAGCWSGYWWELQSGPSNIPDLGFTLHPLTRD